MTFLHKLLLTITLITASLYCSADESTRLLELERKVLAPNYNPLPVVLHKGKGVCL